MKFEKLMVSKDQHGTYRSNIYPGGFRAMVSENEIRCTQSVYNVLRRRLANENVKKRLLLVMLQRVINTDRAEWLLNYTSENDNCENDNKEENTATDATNLDGVKTALKTALGNLINFFSEFSFEPNFRFVNTFAYALQESSDKAKEFVRMYFELSDKDYNGVYEKMKSIEFIDICKILKNIAPTHRVNNRFKLYYGSQGTGKTTQALKETNNNCMVCHSAMLPSDLMEDFKFIDGKATFIPSALQTAIVEGKKIVLDEINLLPFESLRFLQSILDGKSEFEYKGKTVKIADGFMIIGTMNLTVNGCTYALPEPLVDRAQELKKFKLDAKSLVSAII